MRYSRVVVLVFSVLFVCFYKAGAFCQERAVVKIGVILPLHGSGVSYGTDAKRVLEILQDKYNLASKKYHFQIFFEDGQCGVGNAAISSWQKLKNIDHAQMFIAGCSGEVLQVASLANRTKTVLIGYAASHPDIKLAGEFIFRTYADVVTGVLKLANYIKRNNFERIALLTEQQSFTEGIRRAVLATIPGRVSADESFNVNETDFHALLSKLKLNPPDAIYLNCGSPATYQSLLQQVKAAGFKQPLFSYHMPADSSSITNLGLKQEGVVYVSVPEGKASTNDFQELQGKYLSRFGEEIQIPGLAHAAYDAGVALMSAVEAVGVDSQSIHDLFLTWTGEGAAGPIKFDANGDMLDVSMGLQIIQGGMPKSLE